MHIDLKRLVVQVVVFFALFGLALFIPAGTPIELATQPCFVQQILCAIRRETALASK